MEFLLENKLIQMFERNVTTFRWLNLHREAPHQIMHEGYPCLAAAINYHDTGKRYNFFEEFYPILSDSFMDA